MISEQSEYARQSARNPPCMEDEIDYYRWKELSRDCSSQGLDQLLMYLQQEHAAGRRFRQRHVDQMFIRRISGRTVAEVRLLAAWYPDSVNRRVSFPLLYPKVKPCRAEATALFILLCKRRATIDTLQDDDTFTLRTKALLAVGADVSERSGVLVEDSFTCYPASMAIINGHFGALFAMLQDPSCAIAKRDLTFLIHYHHDHPLFPSILQKIVEHAVGSDLDW